MLELTKCRERKILNGRIENVHSFLADTVIIRGYIREAFMERVMIFDGSYEHFRSCF